MYYRCWKSRLKFCLIGIIILVAENISSANNINKSSYIDLRNEIVDISILENIYEQVKLNNIRHIYWGTVPPELAGLKKK